jgi:hypothetical protein
MTKDSTDEEARDSTGEETGDSTGEETGGSMGDLLVGVFQNRMFDPMHFLALLVANGL